MAYKKHKGLKIFILFIITLAVLGAALFASLRGYYPVKYRSLVIQYSNEYELDPYLVLAIIKQESNFDPNATSNKNALGLMQVTGATGKWAADKLKIDNFKEEQLYDERTNIRLGCWYLRWLIKNLAEDRNINLNVNRNLVIAAYNGGPGNVKKWLRDSDYSKTGESLDKIPFKETEKYVERVNSHYKMYNWLYPGLRESDSK